MNDQVPWPAVGDKVFTSEGKWTSTAVLDWMLPLDWSQYASGYILAANLIVNALGEKRYNDRDLLIFPCVFLYRQYLELSMKHLLESGWDLLNVTQVYTARDGVPAHVGRKAVPRTHRLGHLWPECRKVLKEVWPEGPNKDLRAVEECLCEFDFDPNAEAFRYPAQGKKDKCPSDLGRVNLEALKETMEKLSTFFDGAICGIEHYLSIRQDMAEEFRP